MFVAVRHSPCANCASNAIANERRETGGRARAVHDGHPQSHHSTGFRRPATLKVTKRNLSPVEASLYTSRTVYVIRCQTNTCTLRRLRCAIWQAKLQNVHNMPNGSHNLGGMRDRSCPLGHGPKRRRNAQMKARPHLAYDGKKSLESCHFQRLSVAR
jgi:hypothetical protein